MRRRQTASQGATTQIISRLGPVTPLGFIGRARELSEVLDALRRERVVSVVGAVGAGKSELGHEVARRVSAERRVAEVGCRPDDTAEALRARIERRLDAVAGALGDALASTLLVIDDLHHLGTAADPLVADLSRLSPTSWILILSEDKIPLRQGGRELHLGPLAVDDARALWTRLEELFGPTPHGACDAALARTRVPLALRREYAQTQRPSGKSWDVGSVPKDERKALAALAVRGGSGRPLLARLLAEDTIDDALRSLARRQLISADADGWFDVHEVTRAAVLAALDADDRRALEAQVAGAILEDTDLADKTERILTAARHLLAAEKHAEVVALLENHQVILLARGGAGEALAIVEQVARRWSDFALTSLHLRVLLRSGRVAAAREVFDAISTPISDATQLVGAELALAAGELALASLRLEPLLAVKDAETKAQAQALAARVDLERGRMQAARARLPESASHPALRRARRDLELRDGSGVEPLVAQGRLADVEAQLAAAEQAARADDDVLAADELARRRARLIAHAGRLAEAQGQLAALSADARSRGAQLAALRAEVDLAMVLVQRGRATAASAVAAAVAEEADGRGLSLIAAEAELAIAAAELEAARPAAAAHAAQALEKAPTDSVRQAARRIAQRAAAWLGEPVKPGNGRAVDDLVVAADAALASGAGDTALELYVSAAARAEKSGRRADLASALAEAARLHHARGDRTAAASAVARALSEGAGGGADRTVARALLVSSALSREDGNLTAARSSVTDALTIARAGGLTVERYAAARAAETLARLAGDVDSTETLAAVGRAAAATIGEHALGAADRLLADLGLAGGSAFRLTTADGGVSYAAQIDGSRLGLERRDLVVDGAAEVVIRSGKRVADLRRRTLLKRLLFLFAGAPGRLFTKEEIVERIWGVEYHPLHHDAALFTNVMRLRRLLGASGPDILRVADGGYLLAPPRDFLFVEKLPG